MGITHLCQVLALCQIYFGTYLLTMPVNARDSAGTSRDKAGTSRDKAGTNRDNHGQAGHSLSVPPCPYLSLSVPVCPCLPMLVLACPVPVHQCLSLFVPVCPCMSPNLLYLHIYPCRLTCICSLLL